MFPLSAGYTLQMGHCLKELAFYEAAECAYRSALLLGAPLGDVADHLMFAAERSLFMETREQLDDLARAVARQEPRAHALPILDELMLICRAYGVQERITSEALVDWMRRGLSYEEVAAALLTLPGSRMPDVAAVARSGVTEFDIEGFPCWKGYKGGAPRTLGLEIFHLARASGEPVRSFTPDPNAFQLGGINTVLTPSVDPVVSIIILNFNKSELAVQSAQSVLSAAIKVPFEVILVDNGSEPAQQAILGRAGLPVRLHFIGVNRLFGEGNNLGAEAARGTYLLFLNNDAFLTEGAVDPMLEAFAHFPDCGAAGPVFRYPEGKLQEAGAFVDMHGNATQRGKGDRDFDISKLPSFDHVDYISAACLMVPRQLFLELDGFSYRYEPAYYEDTNFCMALADSGYRVILATCAVCVHLEGASSLGLDHWRASQRSNRQRRLFASSWRARLTRARGKAMTIEQSNQEQSDSAFSGEGSDASRIDACREELLQRIDPSLLSTLAGGNGPWSLCRLRQLEKNGASLRD
jgi:GT2 family glycosyltransferase